MTGPLQFYHSIHMSHAYKVNPRPFLLDARGCLCIRRLEEGKDVWFVEYSIHFQRSNVQEPIYKQKKKD